MTPKIAKKVGVSRQKFLWAGLKSRDLRTEKLKLATLWPIREGFHRLSNYFRFRDTAAQSWPIFYIWRRIAPPSGQISKFRLNRNYCNDREYVWCSFHPNRMLGRPISTTRPSDHNAKYEGGLKRLKRNNYATLRYSFTLLVGGIDQLPRTNCCPCPPRHLHALRLLNTAVWYSAQSWRS